MGAEIVGLILGFLAKLILGYIEDRRAAQAQRDAGAATTSSQINKETADAERRASEAQANAPTGSQLDDDLASGRRGF